MLGPINASMFTIKMAEGVVAASYTKVGQSSFKTRPFYNCSSNHAATVLATVPATVPATIPATAPLLFQQPFQLLFQPPF